MIDCRARGSSELRSSEIKTWSSCGDVVRAHLSRNTHVRAGIRRIFHFATATSGAIYPLPHRVLRFRTTHFQCQTLLGSTQTMCGVVCRYDVNILFTRRDRYNIFRNLPGIGPHQHFEGHPGYRGFRLLYRCDHSVLQRPSSAHEQTIIAVFSELIDKTRRLRSECLVQFAVRLKLRPSHNQFHEHVIGNERHRKSHKPRIVI
jgi:hypothetical protein